MIIVDLHCDTASEVFRGGNFIKKYNFSKKYPQLQTAAIFTPKRESTPEERRAYLVECERRLANRLAAEGLRYIKSRGELGSVIRSGECGVILSVEGGGGLFADSAELDYMYKRGLRILGFAWDKNELSDSAFDRPDGGMTAEGAALAGRCGELGIIPDCSHMSDRAFYDLFSAVGSPIIATHSNFRAVCDHPRNLTDEMAMKISERGGIIGINIYPPYLSSAPDVTLEDIFPHIDRALELGLENNLAFGFDIDGTGGEYPEGIDEESSIHDRVVAAMLSRYGEELTEKIAGKNALDFLFRALPS